MDEPSIPTKEGEFVKVQAVKIKSEPRVSPEQTSDRYQYGGGGVPRSWLDDFPWLEFVDGELGGVCQVCIETGHDGTLVSIEHHDLLSHAWSIDHQEAESIKEQEAASKERDRSSRDAAVGAGSNGNVASAKSEAARQSPGGSAESPETPEARSQHYEQCQRVRRFCTHWLKIYKWLQYDAQHDHMFCVFCRRQKIGNNSFIQGSRCFKRDTLRAHDMCKEHMLALNAESLATAITNKDKLGALKPSLGKKARFLLHKLLKYFPWLLYNAETQVLICDTCQRHSVNTLYIDCTQEFDHNMIHQHIENRRHQSSMDAEFQSWHMMFDMASEQGDDLELHEISGNHLTSEVFVKTEPGVSPPPLLDPSVPFDSMDSANSDLLVHYSTSKDHAESAIDSDDRVAVNLDSNKSPTGDLLNLKSRVTAQARPLLKGIHRGKIQPTFGRFRAKWAKEFAWLYYEKEQNVMQCLLCKKYKKKNGFVRGIRVFLRSFIMAHVKSVKHKKAAEEEILSDPQSELISSPHAQMLNRLKLSGRQMAVPVVGSKGIRRIEDMHGEGVGIQPSTHSSTALNEIAGRCCDVISSVLEVHDGNNAEISDMQGYVDYAEHLRSTEPYDGEGVPSGSVMLEKKKDGTLYKRIRKFRSMWLRDYPWLLYSAAEDVMRCAVCVKHHRSSAFTKGTRTFHLDNIKKHEGSSGHQRAVGLELM